MSDNESVAHDPSARYAGTSPRFAWGGNPQCLASRLIFCRQVCVVPC